MAKRAADDMPGEIAENVTTVFARNGEIIPIVHETSLTDDVMRSIGQSGNAFADAMAIAEQLGVAVVDIAEEIGTGFQLLPKEQKGTLVGVPFIILRWRIHDGDFDSVFASASLVTEDGRKLIVVDGSTGICEQLRSLMLKTGRASWVRCPRGLRASQYATCRSCGKPRTQFDETCASTLDNGTVCGNTDTARGTGETFYLDISA